MRKEVEMYLIAVLLLGIVFLFAFFFDAGFTGTGFAVYEQNNAESFNVSGAVFENVTYNETAIVLEINQTSGAYTSQIFDSNNTNASWNNLTFLGVNVDFEIRACESSDCANESFSPANFEDLNLTSQYFQYKAFFSSVNGSSSYLESVALGYSLPEEPESVSVSLSEPAGTKDSLTGIPLEFTTTGSDLTCWYTLDGGVTNNTITDCASTMFDVSDEGSYDIVVYVNGTTLESDTSSFSVTLPTCQTDANLCEDQETCEGAEWYWYNDQCNTNEESQETEDTQVAVEETGETTQELQIITKVELSGVQNQEVNPGESLTLNPKITNSGNTLLRNCGLGVSGDNSDWITVQGEASNLGAGENKNVGISLNVPEEANEGTYRIDLTAECFGGVSDSKVLELEVIPITFEFNLTDVRKIRSDEVRATYDLIDLSGEDQTINLKFALFDNASVKVSEATDTINLSANESDSFRSVIPINESIEGNLTISVEANSQRYSRSVSEPIVLGGAPFLGFVAFGDVITGTSGIVVLVVLVALVAVIVVVRRVRRKSKHLKQ